MRGIIVMAMFAVSLSYAGSGQYTEVRNFDLDASGLSEVFIDAGAGAMVVSGVDGSDEVVVVATIIVDSDDPEEALKFIEKRLRLDLTRDGDRAVLKAGFSPGWGWDADAAVDLDVRMPAQLALVIDDGSGSLTIVAAAGDVYVEDGSGPIDIRQVRGSVTVDDGSGDIEIDDVEHDLVIEEEGSGSLHYANVRGSVQQRD